MWREESLGVAPVSSGASGHKNGNSARFQGLDYRHKFVEVIGSLGWTRAEDNERSELDEA